MVLILARSCQETFRKPSAGRRAKNAVISAMIAFRNALLTAEAAPADTQAWNNLNHRLIELSKALRESTPQYRPQPTVKSGG